ncbi:hypothetical protein H7F37_03490 [Winogradskyella sp. PAMC22761]|nr:hypothetical protein H7F37_03490 [Winogradskyella sp. PAMC22761]
MKIKTKHIALTLFLVDAFLLIINMEYRDETLSVIPYLNFAKFLFCLGTLSFVIYLIIAKSKETLFITVIISIISFSLSLFYNLRIAKDNYDRIQCLKGISEYFQYFEYESCSKIEKRFEADLKNGEIIYFQDEYNPDLEFEEKLRDKYSIELIGISCTRYTSMNCYNDLVKDYIRKKNEKIIE